MKRYAEQIVAYRKWVIAITLLITMVLVVFAGKVKIVIDPAELAPQHHPYIKSTNAVDAVFGSKYFMVISVTPKQGDLFQPAVLGPIERLTRKLEQTDGVVKSTLISLAARQAKAIKGTEEGFEARPLLNSETLTAEGYANLKAALQNNPVYMNTIVSKDFRTAAILVELKERSDGFQKMVQPIQELVDAEQNADIDVALGGNPVYLAQAELFSKRIEFLFPIAILVIGLLHFEAFRTKQGLILPLVTALMAVAWGQGFMGLLNRPMDIFNSPTPLLILAVAAGHAVQLLKRYYEEFGKICQESPSIDRKLANNQAVIRSLVGVGPVMVIAGVVAALGFFSLLVFDIATIRSFGVFTGMGILSAVFLEMTFIPAVRSLLPAPKDSTIAREQRKRIWDQIPIWIGKHIVEAKKRHLLFGGLLALVLLSLVGMNKIVIDNSSKNFFAADLPIQQADNFLNNQLGGTNSIYIMVDGGAADTIKDPKILKGIEHLQRFVEGQPHVGKTLSLVDYIQRMHQAMNGDQPLAETIPNDGNLISQYLFLYSMSGEPGDFDSYVDYQYQKAKITILLKTSSNVYNRALVAKLEEEAKKTFDDQVVVSFGGDVTQTIALTDTMVEGKLRNIIQIALAIFFISAIAFRSLTAGFIVLMPLAMAVVAIFGVMGAFGIPLNIPNSLISAMAVGIGADYAIYLLYRMREQVRLVKDGNLAIQNTLATAGKAALFVATAIAGGYGVLMLSIGYNVQQWLGLFIVIAMVVSVLISLTLVPALLLSWRPNFIFETKKQSSWRVFLVLIIGSAVAILANSAVRLKAEELPSATDIMEKNFVATKVKDSEGAATFTLTNKNGESRVRKTRGFTRLAEGSDDNMRLVRFHAPADIKGTATLLLEHSVGDDDMWVYLPALGKTRRLVSSNKKDSFVGTDFSYGDVVGHKPQDWSHTLLRSENISGANCYVIASIPVNDAIKNNTGYSKRETYVNKDNFVALRTDFWDLSGRPLKRITADNIRQVGTNGRYQAFLSVAENLQTGHSTRIEFDEFAADKNLDASLFRPQSLEK
jgi:uncharacterized protein